ncbi:serine/threonine-protein kinase/endoribonuclease IRE2-like isoform X2 [Daphnia carinata]|uniref:serine/threonine-protein kinase/endoribonuclease IRE2-like isoform X2 n=1 Tax=Daphnia carinata TaxID=120202 RepID=UPI00257D7549|nr:serine/threonine-protein kinase/endoribonuclease IRE2-like isoform X2 [Daphnia carinata]
MSRHTFSLYLCVNNMGTIGSKIQFDSNKPLGKGGFGEVYLGEYDGNKVAVKIVDINNVDEREINAMKELTKGKGHPNIVKLFWYFALELCAASLDKAFLGRGNDKKYNGPLPPHIDMFLQLAAGLEYIHSMNFIHRDIKPQNILISVRNDGQKEEITIKWADFGLTKPVSERGTFDISEICGTDGWFAPEILRMCEKRNIDSRGNVKSDVFVLALVFGYLLLKGKHLYGSNVTQIDRNILKNAPVNMTEIGGELRQLYEHNLLRKMLEDEPKNRMSSTEVFKELTSIKQKLAAK